MFGFENILKRKPVDKPESGPAQPAPDRRDAWVEDTATNALHGFLEQRFEGNRLYAKELADHFHKEGSLELTVNEDEVAQVEQAFPAETGIQVTHRLPSSASYRSYKEAIITFSRLPETAGELPQ